MIEFLLYMYIRCVDRHDCVSYTQWSRKRVGPCPTANVFNFYIRPPITVHFALIADNLFVLVTHAHAMLQYGDYDEIS